MNPSSNLLAGKSAGSSSSHSSTQQYSPQQSPSFDSARRVSSTASSTPRNNQSQRKQHKNKSRPKLVDEDAMAESRAIRNTGGRRGQTSITHLMSFNLPPRPQYAPRAPRRHYSSYHTVDKARYVHANYRFIVKPSGDYRAQAVDADVYLDWDNILQILVSGKSQQSTCPICLSSPVATRMAKCGHMFCLPCLIRYMHSTDDSNPVPEKRARWKKCPICYDPVYISEVRPVRWYAGEEPDQPQEGDDIMLKLVERLPGSTLALPKGEAAKIKFDDIPWFVTAGVADFARVTKGDEDYMSEQYDEEIGWLEEQEKEDELMFGEENHWTQKAIANIREAKVKIVGIGNAPASARERIEPKSERPPIQFNPGEETPEMYNIKHAAISGIVEQIPPSTEQDTTQQEVLSTSPTHSKHQHRHRHTRGASGSHPSHAPYFFYQGLLHYYLAPLDIRILKEHFGSFEKFHAQVLARVEHVSNGHIIDEDLRKRTKYLSHLPYGCEVGFLECDWSGIVSDEVLEKFRADIERRRKRNKDKEIREEKDRVRAEKEEGDKSWASARRKRPSITTETFNSFAEDPSLIEAISLSNAEAGNLVSGSPPYESRHGSTFEALASPSTSPGTTTVWGTRGIAPNPEDLISQPAANDGWFANWENELTSAEDAITAQVQAASLNEGTSTGKKKKAKKITLMSTTGRRAA